MIELIGGLIGKIIGWILPASWKYAGKRWRRPAIESLRTPANLFQHLAPGVSKDRVKEVLGSPHRTYSTTWAYRFIDAMVQIEFWENGGAKSIVLGITIHTPKGGFAVPMLAKPIGSMTLADAMEEDEGQLEYRSSLRTEELVWVARIGPPGAWLYYTFGALSPLAPGYLRESIFAWDRDEEKLKSNPSDVLLNWVGVSASGDEVRLDWSLGLPGI